MDLQSIVDGVMQKIAADVYAKEREAFKKVYRDARPGLVAMGTTITERLAMGTIALDFVQIDETTKMTLLALLKTWIMEVENEATLEANNDHA